MDESAYNNSSEKEICKSEKIKKRKETAYNIAKAKLVDSHGKIESVMQTAEAFGRGLYHDYMQRKTLFDNVDEWFDPIQRNILDPLDERINFKILSDQEIRTSIPKDFIPGNKEESEIATVFTYGYLRGMLLSAFPKGEIILDEIKNPEDVLKFTIKKEVTEEHKFEREKVKRELFGKK